jgi:hypothetical protein
LYEIFFQNFRKNVKAMRITVVNMPLNAGLVHFYRM